jgi:hypothetical protein
MIENNADYNIYQSVHPILKMYKIYNPQEKGKPSKWGQPKHSPIGLTDEGKLGEHVAKWLIIVQSTKNSSKGEPTSFKGYMRAESNGYWLTVTQDGSVITNKLEQNRILCTFTPHIDQSDLDILGYRTLLWTISTEDGRTLHADNYQLSVSPDDANTTYLILDQVFN